MAFERKWSAVPPQPFTADGSVFGLVTVASTCGFYVKQSVFLIKNSGATLPVQVKKVLSPTQLIVGTIDNAKISSWPPLDISSWTVASGAKIGAEEQNKNVLPPEDHQRAIYEGDPIAADRVIPVDCNGNHYNSNNPFPVSIDGTDVTVDVGTVRITACDNDPKPGDIHSSVRISDCANDLKINPDGSINVVVEQEPTPSAENITITYNESAPVASGLQTDILFYSVPVGQTATLQRVFASGENIAKFDVLVNGVVIATERTYFGSALDVNFLFNSSNGLGTLLNSGDIVTVRVLHNRPNTALFEATLEIILNPTVTPGQNVIVSYNEMLVIAPNTSSTIESYTVPPGQTANLQRVMASGTNIARFDILVNSSIVATKRTYFGGALNVSFEFTGFSGGGVPLAAGDIVSIKAISTRPTPTDFEGTIEVIEF